MGPDTTTFTAMVRHRMQQRSHGDVRQPAVSTQENAVIVTFTVAGEPTGAANCLGNDEVTYGVSLPEPLGDRTLVDGQCEPGGEGRAGRQNRPRSGSVGGSLCVRTAHEPVGSPAGASVRETQTASGHDAVPPSRPEQLAVEPGPRRHRFCRARPDGHGAVGVCVRS